MQIKPLGDRVVLELMPKEEVLKSGIIIPDTASQEKNDRGTVVAVGPGKILENGQLAAMNVIVGDKVIFSSYSSPVEIDDKKYLIIREDDILAVLA
ncbi:co-chaperone GroES [Patescibacteria group bacterium]|nr:co-chaperone GroES [Patescibacteria group bacterium]